VRHGDHPRGTFRRPPTSCAHRLRKPDRTYELLALSVARWTRRCGLRPTAPSTPKGGLPIRTAPFRDATIGHLPSHQVARCRRRFRTTTTRRTRAPSVSSSSNLAARAGSATLVVHVAQPHPAPCRLLRAWACLVKGRLVASSYLALPRPALPFPAWMRRVTTRERCASPTSATDSRHEHPADCPIPGAPHAAPRLLASRGSSCVFTRDGSADSSWA